MKKFIVICGLMTIAQFSVGQKFAFGLKAGINVANQTISQSGLSGSVGSYTAFHAGVFTTFMFSDRVGLQPEALYSVQGWDFNNFGLQATLKLNYLTIPVLFRINANKIFHVDAGPQVGFLLSSEVASMGMTGNADDSFSSTDFGLAFGMGVDLSKVTLSFRYYTGLVDVDKNPDTTITSKNTNIQISMGYKFVNK